MLYVCILKKYICNMCMIYVSFESISFHLIAKNAPRKIPRPDSPEKSQKSHLPGLVSSSWRGTPDQR